MEFFSRSAMSIVGALLLATLVLAVYGLWDVAINRWF